MELPTYLAKHKHPRDKRIVFDEGPHIYYIDGDDSYHHVPSGIIHISILIR